MPKKAQQPTPTEELAATCRAVRYFLTQYNRTPKREALQRELLFRSLRYAAGPLGDLLFWHSPILPVRQLRAAHRLHERVGELVRRVGGTYPCLEM